MKGATRAIVLSEMLIALAFFGVLSVVLFMAANQTAQVWSKVSSEQSAQFQLGRASAALQREASMVSLGSSSVTPVPSLHHAGANDGDAFWFLSPKQSGEGAALVKADGRPFWQCNVLYYLVTPDQAQQLSTDSLIGGVDADGYEDRCPYKVLVRKVIDQGPPTDPTDQNSEEPLLLDVTPYLTRPVRYDVSSMLSEPGVLSAKVVATEMLSFRVRQSQNFGSELLFDLRAVAINDARKQSGYGQTSLSSGPFTLQNQVSLAANN